MTDKCPGGVAKDARDIRRCTRREKHTLESQGHVRQLVNVLGMTEVARTVWVASKTGYRRGGRDSLLYIAKRQCASDFGGSPACHRDHSVFIKNGCVIRDFCQRSDDPRDRASFARTYDLA